METLPLSVVNEVIVTGRKKRILIDKAAKLWQCISEWTKASDVEFDDGKTAEQKVGNINGITSDFSVDNESIAASSSLTNRAYERFQEFTDDGRINRIIIGEDGKPYIEYWDEDGADTVLKKLGNIDITDDNIDAILVKRGWADQTVSNATVTHTVTIDQNHIDNDYKFYFCFVASSGAINTATSNINLQKSSFGKNAVQLYNSSIGGSRPEWEDATGGSLKMCVYALPPQEVGTELKVCVGGFYYIGIYGVK